MDTKNRQIIDVAGGLVANPLADDDLAWRAFCYLHGELTADEAEAFEEDLAVEQAAREALARAVKLTGALKATGEMPSAPIGYGTRSVPTTLGGRPAWWRRLARPQLIIGTAVAACFVVAVTLGIWGRFGGNDQGADNAQAALAKAWAEIGPSEEWRSPPPSPEHDSDPNADDDRGHGDHEEDLNLPSVPSWMLAAVDPKSESREMKQ